MSDLQILVNIHTKYMWRPQINWKEVTELKPLRILMTSLIYLDFVNKQSKIQMQIPKYQK